MKDFPVVPPKEYQTLIKAERVRRMDRDEGLSVSPIHSRHLQSSVSGIRSVNILSAV